MVVYEQTRLLHLILKCWLSDKAGVSGEDIENERKLIEEVRDAVSEDRE
jgi:hypothetical protein